MTSLELERLADLNHLKRDSNEPRERTSACWSWQNGLEADAMLPEIERELPEIEALCRRFGVRHLELFGSAAGNTFDVETSDVDLLIEIEPPPGMSYSDAYFGFLEGAAKRFQRPVDLVALRSLRNPYFIEGIAKSRRLLYAA